MKKNKKLSFITFVILGFMLVGCGSDSSSTKDSNKSDDVKITSEEDNSSSELDLPTTLINKSSFLIQKADNEAIKDSVSTLAYAYYYRPNGKDKRWYISNITLLGEKVDVYSLMGFRNNKNGWGTVGAKVASVNLNNETITIGHIDDNPSYTYVDVGWNETTTNPIIQNDIELIRNQTVTISWWFFKVNKSWFIINKSGDVWKFITKILDNGKKDIGWDRIDMGDSKPTFFIEGGKKKMRFGTTNTTPKIISTYYDRDSKTVYLLASSDIHSPSVYFTGKHALTNNCLGDNEYVYSMNRQALTDVNTNVKGELELEARRKGIAGISLTGGGSSSSSYQIPAVYYFNWDAPLTKQVHFNVVGLSSGKYYSSGWKPDNGGGCTYTPNPLK